MRVPNVAAAATIRSLHCCPWFSRNFRPMNARKPQRAERDPWWPNWTIGIGLDNSVDDDRRRRSAKEGSAARIVHVTATTCSSCQQRQRALKWTYVSRNRDGSDDKPSTMLPKSMPVLLLRLLHDAMHGRNVNCVSVGLDRSNRSFSVSFSPVVCTTTRPQ